MTFLKKDFYFCDTQPYLNLMSAIIKKTWTLKSLFYISFHCKCESWLKDCDLHHCDPPVLRYCAKNTKTKITSANE